MKHLYREHATEFTQNQSQCHILNQHPGIHLQEKAFSYESYSINWKKNNCSARYTDINVWIQETKKKENATTTK